MGKAHITFYHPKDDGSGMALRLSLFYQTNETDGFIRLSFANQSDTEFDFENCINCDLKFDLVSRLINSLKNKSEGNCQPIEISKDLFFATKYMEEKRETVIAVASRKLGENGNRSISLAEHESEGLLNALKGSMFFLAFIKGISS